MAKRQKKNLKKIGKGYGHAIQRRKYKWTVNK